MSCERMYCLGIDGYCGLLWVNLEDFLAQKFYGYCRNYVNEVRV